MAFSKIKPLIVTLCAMLYAPGMAIACDQNFFGGSLTELRRHAHQQFSVAKERAWSRGRLTRAQVEALKIKDATHDLATIRLSAGTSVELTDYFLRVSLHLAVMDTFNFIAAESISAEQRAEASIVFEQRLQESARNGWSIKYYPLEALGLSSSECWEIVRKTSFDVQTHFSIIVRTVWEFWFLHEIAHAALDHRPGLAGRASWKQEYASDIWAVEVLRDSLSTDLFIFTSNSITRSMGIFAGSQVVEIFGNSLTHPSPACRELRLLELVDEVYENRFVGPHDPLLRFNGEANNARLEYLQGSIQNSSVRC